MAVVAVVADDLTGANATGARFTRAGFRAITVSDHRRVGGFRDTFDAVVVNLQSRHLPPHEAAGLVHEAIEALGEVPLVVKRVDTTLRGNVGAEAEAARAAVSSRCDQPVRALVVPAFPDSGRVTIGGLQLLDGVPIHETEVARDPLTPVRTSGVRALLAEQTDLPSRLVDLEMVLGPPEELSAALGGDEPLLVIEALDEGHLARIAAAAADAAERDGVRWVSVDPGPFGVHLAQALGLRGEHGGPAPVLAVAGSATALTRRQLDMLVRERDADLVTADIGAWDHAGLAEALCTRLDARREGGVVGVRTAAGADDVVELDAAQGRRIPEQLAELTAEVLDSCAVGGLYLTGGDVTTAVLAVLGAHGLHVEDEVLPLAVAGRLVGGPHDGLPVVTKGGLVGGVDGAVRCVDALRRRVELAERQVPASS